MKLIVFILALKIVTAKLNIDITAAGTNINDVTIAHSGFDIRIINDQDIQLFGIVNRKLNEALKTHYGKQPKNYYLKSPMPWGDLYEKYHWEQVSRVLSIKSSRVKGITKQPVIILSQDFENVFNNSIKVNTGISQTVENTITTSWSKNNEITVSQEIEYDVNVIFMKMSGSTGLSYTTSWGKSEEKSETVTIGTTSAVETELKPGQAATAVLSATRGYLEIEVIYAAKLRGNVVVNFKRQHNGHHFWGPTIDDVMKSGDIDNELTFSELIKIGFYSDASLKVFDKITKAPL